MQPIRDKNQWEKSKCSLCGKVFDGNTHKSADGKIHFYWCGQSMNGDYVWECAKCLYNERFKNGFLEKDEDEV